VPQVYETNLLLYSDPSAAAKTAGMTRHARLAQCAQCAQCQCNAAVSPGVSWLRCNAVLLMHLSVTCS
jgi:hypothetical protein